MRLSEREALMRRNRGVVTMADVAKDRKSQDVASRKAEEKRQKAAKEAAKGAALPGLEVGR